MIQKQPALEDVLKSKKDLRYTLIPVPGEVKKNYCKIMTNVRIFSKDQPFPLEFLKGIIMTYGGDRGEHHYKSGHSRPERIPIESERADALIKELLQKGYLRYYGKQKRDKLHPNIPEDGLKKYIFDKFKIIECEESRYFQTKLQRKGEPVKERTKLSERRCKTLRQIYAQFGDKLPFTYEMVRNISRYYTQMAESKDPKVSAETKIYYRMAAQQIESRKKDFGDDFGSVWNSLIRNNYLVPYRVRTKDGTIKIREGAYKVNMDYVRRCLSEINI